MARTSKRTRRKPHRYIFSPGMGQKSWAEFADRISYPATRLLWEISMNFLSRGYVTYHEAAACAHRAGYRWSSRELDSLIAELERAQCIHKAE